MTQPKNRDGAKIPKRYIAGYSKDGIAIMKAPGKPSVSKAKIKAAVKLVKQKQREGAL